MGNLKDVNVKYVAHATSTSCGICMMLIIVCRKKIFIKCVRKKVTIKMNFQMERLDKGKSKKLRSWTVGVLGDVGLAKAL